MPEVAKFRTLIQRVRDRDEEAARELTLKYEGVIRRVIRIHLRDRRLRQVLDSMDVCQSVLASFFIRTALGQYDLERPEQLINLLTIIAKNKLANQANRFRAQRRDVRRTQPLGDEAFTPVDRASDPSEQVAAREILQRVRKELDSQTLYLADQRALGRSWQELADEVGGTDVALRKRLTRALDRVLVDLGVEAAQDV